jgi:ribonuclease P protein component
MAGRHGYPKAARLRRRREFLEVQREGTRRHTQHLVLIHRAAAGAGSRLGVTVSTRVGDAVERNRVKRLLREVFRHCRSSIQPPADLVVIAKPGADTLTYAQAANELVRALGLRRAG